MEQYASWTPEPKKLKESAIEDRWTDQAVER